MEMIILTHGGLIHGSGERRHRIESKIDKSEWIIDDSIILDYMS